MGKKIDISKAAAAKNLQMTFTTYIENLRKLIDGLEEEFNKNYDKYNPYRKERAVLIEEVIKFLKDNKIKTKKPLGQCQNEELIAELLDIIPELPFSAQETVQIAIVRIDNRYKLIAEYYQKCIDIINYVATNFKLPEMDTKDEVSFDSIADMEENMNKINSSEELVTEDNHLKESDDIPEKPASDTTYMEKPKDIRPIDYENVEKTSEDYEETFEDVFNNDNSEDDLSSDKIISIFDHLAEGSKIENTENELDESAKYKLNGTVSLEDVVKSVYGDVDFLYDFYEYGANKEIIDDLAAAYNVDPIDIMRDKEFIKDVELEFPTELKSQIKKAA